MKLRILLVNPWIYAFTAYNLRARPLDLLKVGEYLSAFDAEISLHEKQSQIFLCNRIGSSGIYSFRAGGL